MNDGADNTARQVDPAAAQRWLAVGEAILIDVRDEDAYARERIAGARLVPLSRFDPAAAEGGGKKVIMQCRSGRRSAEACRLAGGGAYNLVGGIEAWKSAGLPVERGGGGSAISVLRQTQLVIGAFVIAGAAAGVWVSPWFLVVPAFFGAGLMFAGATGTCGLAAVLGRMPWNRAV